MSTIFVPTASGQLDSCKHMYVQDVVGCYSSDACTNNVTWERLLQHAHLDDCVADEPLLALLQCVHTQQVLAWRRVTS
jgi:hypothetical protein